MQNLCYPHGASRPDRAPLWPGVLTAALVVLILLAAPSAGAPADSCNPLTESVITGQVQCLSATSLRSL